MKLAGYSLRRLLPSGEREKNKNEKNKKKELGGVFPILNDYHRFFIILLTPIFIRWGADISSSNRQKKKQKKGRGSRDTPAALPRGTGLLYPQIHFSQNVNYKMLIRTRV